MESSGDIISSACLSLERTTLSKRLEDNTDDEAEERDTFTEDDFTDVKTITAPKNLQELISQLHRVFRQDHINVDYVQALMESYESNPKDWKKFAKFDVHRYTRNLVDEGNGKFNLIVLCWNEGQSSSIHSHAGSHCFLKVLAGDAKEELYEWPEESMTSQTDEATIIEAKQGKEMKQGEEHVFHKNQCTYISDNIGLHRVENPSHTDKTVTLHLYSPPFDECYCFDQRTGKKLTAKVTFWSKFGKRTPFGKDPNRICSRENN